MTLLDAYGLVALLADEPAAGEVETLLRHDDASVVVANLAEAIDVSRRVYGLRDEELKDALQPLLAARVLSVVVSGEAEAWAAAEIRVVHYERKARPLSLADGFLLAHAVATNQRIATADPPLAETARLEGLEVVALPSSSGARP